MKSPTTAAAIAIVLRVVLTLGALHVTTSFSTTTTTTTTFPAWSYRRVVAAPLRHIGSSSSSAAAAPPTLLRVSSVDDASIDASSSSSSSEGDKNSSSNSNATSAAAAATTTTSTTTTTTTATKQPSFPVILWKFTRPHTIIGSALAIPALHLLAAPSLSAALAPRTVQACLYAMIPSLFMNLYITGLNQITDVEIDKINKPYLPLAAGYLSKSTATVIVLVSLIVSLGMGSMFAPHPIFATQGLQVALWGSAILGTLYSLEPFRLKRFPVLAAFCIVAVRGALINAGFFAHAQAAAFGPTTAAGGTAAAGVTVWHCLTHNASCLWSSVFFAVFGIVIALMKDVPDVVGDKQSNIRTFPVRIGPTTVFNAMRRLLSCTFVACGVAFLARAVLLLLSTTTNNSGGVGVAAARVVTGLSSIFFGWSVQKESAGVDPTDSKQVYNFYMHLWKLFYASYLVLPFAM